jgi:hypothetical protein
MGMGRAVAERERAALVAAPPGTRTVREWRRYQAIRRRAAGVGVGVAAVAPAVGCPPTRVSTWTAAGRAAGAVGIAEGRYRGGGTRPAAAQTLETRRAQDPPAHGHAATGGSVARRRGGERAAAARRARATAAVRPGAGGPGRPGKQGALVAPVAATLAAGGAG